MAIQQALCAAGKFGTVVTFAFTTELHVNDDDTTFGSNPTTGNDLICVFQNTGGTTYSSVQATGTGDSTSGTIDFVPTSADNNTAFCRIANVASGTNTIEITMSGGATVFPVAVIEENTTLTFQDSGNYEDQTSATQWSQSFTTSQADSLIVQAVKIDANRSQLNPTGATYGTSLAVNTAINRGASYDDVPSATTSTIGVDLDTFGAGQHAYAAWSRPAAGTPTRNPFTKLFSGPLGGPF